MEQKIPEQAVRYFAQAAEYNPDDPASLIGLAQALYITRNLQQALNVLEKSRLRELDEEHYLALSALFLAALDRQEEAEDRLQSLRQRYSTSSLLTEAARTSSNWQRYFLRTRNINGMNPERAKASQQGPSAAPDVVAEPDKASDSNKTSVAASASKSSIPRMVVVDAVILRLDENQYARSGINLLETLKIEFEGSRTRGLFNANALGSNWSPGKTILNTSISIPKISYTLYIFNTHSANAQVIAQPSLTATKGSSAKFFSGTNISVALVGQYNSNLIDKEVGVTLDITPTFLDENKVKLEVHAARSFVDPGIVEVATFQQAMRSSVNDVKTSVVMEMGQTLVLSGLTERQINHKSDKVDVLGDIPVLGKLFSEKNTEDIATSVVILLTPRQPESFRAEQTPSMDAKLKSLDAQRHSLFSPFNLISNIDSNVNRIAQISASQQKQFRDNLLEMGSWDQPQQLEKTIAEAYKEAKRELR